MVASGRWHRNWLQRGKRNKHLRYVHFNICKIHIKKKIQTKIWHVNATEYDSTGMNYGGTIFTKITQNNAIYLLWTYTVLCLHLDMWIYYICTCMYAHILKTCNFFP